MKKITLLLAGVVAVTALVTGCTSTHVSKYSSTLDVKIESEAKPTVEVGGVINGEATIKRVLFFTFGASKFAECVDFGGSGMQGGLFDSIGINFEAGKAAASYDACEKAKCDVILAPKYEIEYENYFVYAQALVKVQGYKGNFKGLKK